MYESNKGNTYEDIAVKYLLDKGYIVKERNFTCRMGEIDIIADDKDTIVFIEVKGRKNSDFGMPSEYVTASKIKKILATSRYYLMKMGQSDSFCRFDVIEIVSKDYEINHIENAFGE